MHEVGIITQAVEMAIDHARHEKMTRVVRIRLDVGVLSGVVPEALAFGFDMVTKGTCAENALLEIHEIPARCLCPNKCGEFEPDGPIFECPKCGCISSNLLAGRELNLVEIEAAN